MKFLTLPGLLVMIVTGLILTTHCGFFRTRWLNVKHLLIVIIAVNAFAFILPAETDALRFAQASPSTLPRRPGRPLPAGSMWF